MNLFCKIICLSAVLYLIGCGSGGESENSSSNPVVDTSGPEEPALGEPESIQIGRFVDSPVEGVSFATESQSGVTNANGEYQYEKGEDVTFSIGRVVFPTAPATEIVSPLELVGTTNINDPTVINISRLLQTLDYDNTPENGIQITPATVSAAESTSLTESDFAVQPDEFSSNEKVMSLVESADYMGASPPLVSVDSAVAHLSNELNVEQNKPNVIVILADDLGYGSLGSYRQQHIKTPELDKMAEDGIRFTDFYSGAPWCPPARSSFMTGLHTGHTFLRDKGPLRDDLPLLSKKFKEAGYVTAMFGKWGMSEFGDPNDKDEPTESLPNKVGFDHFLGFLTHRDAHVYYFDSPASPSDHSSENPYSDRRQHLYQISQNNIEKYMIPESRYIHNELMDKTVEFIKDNHSEPFFLYLPLTIPHTELAAPRLDDPLFPDYNSNPDKNDDEIEGYFNSDGSSIFNDDPDWKGDSVREGETRSNGKYRPNDAPWATYASMISRMDRDIGYIRRTLDDLGISENTLIIFTSDNGPLLSGPVGGFVRRYKLAGENFESGKFRLYEGGIRVPMIAVWPDRIPKNSETNEPTALWDLYATFSEVVGFVPPPEIDSISLVPLFEGHSPRYRHDDNNPLYWETFKEYKQQAVRVGNWKAVRERLGSADNLVNLYDLTNGEERLISNAEHSQSHCETLQRLKRVMNESHSVTNESFDPAYYAVVPLRINLCEAVSDSSSYQDWVFRTSTALSENTENFEFLMAENRDLVAVKKSGSDSSRTEVHILSAASYYQDWILHVSTLLHETDDNYKFLIAKNRDIFVIKKSNTSSAKTEVHILSAENNYRNWSLQVPIEELEETDSKYEFLLAENRDLVVIKKSNTGSSSTEVHILSAVSNYQNWVLQTGTILGETDDNHEFLMAKNRDLIVIKRSNTISSTTEIRTLSAVSNYQNWALQTSTILEEVGDNVDFLIAENRDVVAVRRSNTNSSSTELDILAAEPPPPPTITTRNCSGVCIEKTCNLNAPCTHRALDLECKTLVERDIDIVDMEYRRLTSYEAPLNNQERVIIGTSGDDLIKGGGGVDRICGLSGKDEIRGLGGNDIINGNAGIDFINGNEGDDVIKGGNDDDCLRGGKGDDIIIGNRGADDLDGGMGIDELDGDGGALTDDENDRCVESEGLIINCEDPQGGIDVCEIEFNK